MGYRTSVSYTSGTATPASENLTVPAGVVATDTIYILCGTATTTAGNHAATGFTVVGTLGGFALGTSGRATLLKGTGKVAGDTITVTNPATGITGALLVAYANTTTEDLVGTPAATSTAQTSVAPSPGNTSQANELVIDFVVFLDNAANSVSNLGVATSRATSTAGGNIRFFAFGVGDRVVAANAAAIGTVTNTANATGQLGSTSIQVSHKTAVVSGGSTARKTNVAGVSTATGRKANVAGVSTAATRRVDVAGVAT